MHIYGGTMWHPIAVQMLSNPCALGVPIGTRFVPVQEFLSSLDSESSDGMNLRYFLKRKRREGRALCFSLVFAWVVGVFSRVCNGSCVLRSI